jgi:hypothetical protein
LDCLLVAIIITAEVVKRIKNAEIVAAYNKVKEI